MDEIIYLTHFKNIDPPMIYMVGKLWISAFSWYFQKKNIDPTGRQNFGDAPGQIPKLILTLCHIGILGIEKWAQLLVIIWGFTNYFAKISFLLHFAFVTFCISHIFIFIRTCRNIVKWEMGAICRCWWWFGIPSDWFHLSSLHEPNPPGILSGNSNSIQKIQFKQMFWNFKKGTQDH